MKDKNINNRAKILKKFRSICYYIYSISNPSSAVSGAWLESEVEIDLSYFL